MTNLEKAKDLYHKIGMEETMLSALCEMAEWKEEQIKQYLLHGKNFAQEKGNQDLAELFEIIIEDLKL